MLADDLRPEVLRAHSSFHGAVGRAHSRLAHELATLAAREEDGPELPSVRGAVQRRILRQPGLFTERGMTATEVAAALDHDEPNTHTSLTSLQKAGLLELIGDTSPRRWRHEQQQRTDRVLLMSRLVPRGRWTTYGDFAIAVYGNLLMARAVARAAAKNLAFANPHRVLMSRGRISPGWRDEQGRGPERCRELLEEDGVRVSPNGIAAARAFIGWEELKELLDDAEATDDAI